MSKLAARYRQGERSIVSITRRASAICWTSQEHGKISIPS